MLNPQAYREGYKDCEQGKGSKCKKVIGDTLKIFALNVQEYRSSYREGYKDCKQKQ